MNSTSYHHAHISDFCVIIGHYFGFFHIFWQKKIPPRCIYSYKVEFSLTNWNLLFQLTKITETVITETVITEAAGNDNSFDREALDASFVKACNNAETVENEVKAEE